MYHILDSRFESSDGDSYTLHFFADLCEVLSHYGYRFSDSLELYSAGPYDDEIPEEDYFVQYHDEYNSKSMSEQFGEIQNILRSTFPFLSFSDNELSLECRYRTKSLINYYKKMEKISRTRGL